MHALLKAPTTLRSVSTLICTTCILIVCLNVLYYEDALTAEAISATYLYMFYSCSRALKMTVNK